MKTSLYFCTVLVPARYTVYRHIVPDPNRESSVRVLASSPPLTCSLTAAPHTLLCVFMWTTSQQRHSAIQTERLNKNMRVRRWSVFNVYVQSENKSLSHLPLLLLLLPLFFCSLHPSPPSITSCAIFLSLRSIHQTSTLLFSPKSFWLSPSVLPSSYLQSCEPSCVSPFLPFILLLLLLSFSPSYFSSDLPADRRRLPPSVCRFHSNRRPPGRHESAPTPTTTQTFCKHASPCVWIQT